MRGRASNVLSPLASLFVYSLTLFDLSFHSLHFAALCPVVELVDLIKEYDMWVDKETEEGDGESAKELLMV